MRPKEGNEYSIEPSIGVLRIPANAGGAHANDRAMVAKRRTRREILLEQNGTLVRLVWLGHRMCMNHRFNQSYRAPDGVQ